MRIQITGMCCALLISGCVTVPKQWQPVGGSKSDGVVKVGYTVLDVERAETNQQQALDTAINTCKAWGYGSAQPFSLESRTCNTFYGKYGNSSCKEWLITRQYQCLDK